MFTGRLGTSCSKLGSFQLGSSTTCGWIDSIFSPVFEVWRSTAREVKFAVITLATTWRLDRVTVIDGTVL